MRFSLAHMTFNLIPRKSSRRELITSANANVYLNILHTISLCSRFDGFGETQHSHKSAQQDNVNISRGGRSFSPLESPQTPPSRSGDSRRYWLAAPKQVLIRSRPKFIFPSLFFSYDFLVKLEISFFLGKPFFYSKRFLNFLSVFKFFGHYMYR